MNLIRTLSVIAVVVLSLVACALGSTQIILHSFAGGQDGALPVTPLVMDANGNLYGSTQEGGGGTGCDAGCGVIFELTPSAGSWTESVIYTFSGGVDGAIPSGVTFDAAGNLYGTAEFGGDQNNYGLVFELTPNGNGTWTKSTIYVFNGGTIDGCVPETGVIADAHGNLYGTTFDCGTYGYGNVFELTHNRGSWTESVLHNFNADTDGNSPGPPILDKAGNLFGTNQIQGAGKYGTLYELSRNSGSWVFTLLHSFAGPGDGAVPARNLVIDSGANIYGTTWQGGILSCGPKGDGCGTVFKYSSSKKTGSILHQFNNSQAQGPTTGLALDPFGNLYGTVYVSDTAFKLSPEGQKWTFTTLLKLEGSEADAPMITDKQGNLYGVTDGGGAFNSGVVFEIIP